MSHTPELESFYVPDASDSPAAVHVRLSLVHQLGFEMLEALRSIPKRGLEIGGILLGRVELREDGRQTIFVEAYETVECEHEYGPSYEFSPHDRLLFEQVVSRRRNQPPGEPQAVGFFRSRTGSEPEFNAQDIEIARDLFSRQPSLCLLVQPFIDQPGEARIGIWSDDAFHPLETFPFNAGVLLEGGFPIVAAPTPEPAEPEVTNLTAPARAWHSWALSGAAAAMLIVSLTMWSRSHAATAQAEPSEAPRPAATPDAGVSLHVERRDGSAILTWNRAAPDAQRAQSALLVITDADKRRELRLDRTDLQTGRVVYVPESDDISFQLQLLAPGRSSTESVRWLQESPTVPAAAPLPSPQLTATAKSQSGESKADSGDAAEPVPKPTFRVFPQVAVVTPPPIPAPPAVVVPTPTVTSPAVTPSIPPPPAPKLITSVTVEPVGRSVWKKMWGKVSPEHLLHGNDQSGVTPPRPLREVKPRLSDALLSEIDGAGTVDVKVFVGRSGSVTRAELKDHDVDAPIADAVIRAARNWKFEPAHNDAGPIEGLALLHFHLKRSDAGPVVASR